MSSHGAALLVLSLNLFRGLGLLTPALAPVGDLSVPSETFAIVINTFNRDGCLEEVVDHYMTCRGVVDDIRVTWNEPGRAPPEWLTSLEASTASNVAELAPRVIIDFNQGSNLTNRFKPRRFTSEAIFSQDDDLFYSCKLLSEGFKVWQAFPRQLVGFGPRWVPFEDPGMESRDAQGARAAWTSGCANVVLVTKGGWLHRDYYKAFFDPSMVHLRKMVDNSKTAEDMMMALLVANRTGLPPVPLLVPAHAPDLPSWWPKLPNVDWMPGKKETERHLTNFEFQCGGGLTQGPGDSNKRRGSMFKVLLEAFNYFLPSTTTFVDPLTGFFGGPGIGDSKNEQYLRFNRQNAAWKQMGECQVLPQLPGVCATYEQSIRGTTVKLPPGEAYLAMLDPQKRPLLDEEHGLWQPEGCNMRAYRPAEACDVLRRKGHKRVLFVGDSFIRQLYLAFLRTLLEGDVDGQALAPARPWAPSSTQSSRDDLAACTADVVAAEVEAKQCRHHFARDTRQQFDEERQKRLCDGEVDLEFVYGGVKDQDSKEYPRLESANHSATLVVMGFGIWDNFDSSAVIPQAFHHLAEFFMHYQDPTVIWHAAHARHRFDYEHQTNEDVKKFNTEMRAWSGKYTKMKTVDFFNASMSMYSPDGTHYGPGPNRVKSMLLLSFLESLERH